MRRPQKGQALVEFALVSLLLLVFVLGVFDFGYLFFGRVAAYQATRVAARFAATHPAAWTSSPSPDRTTIEGNLALSAVPASIPNQDSNLTISYLVPGAGAPALCGQWSVSSNAFVPQSGYTKATCVVAGNLVQVSATYIYRFITPMLRAAHGTVNISTQAEALIELTPP